ncbi:hypothetical protein L202_06764 [Cryptococcus amylolentus CBS 6039]|uniref:6-phosphogluconolactonase n=1 Tax=Cryptococcus amylolentus CBS 6039 TaxID=1295533 RepID=A0A1E3HDB8_9TREE|nr:hypothetical protein L202_06764 [Cryptococcus amylolentus CBS 6039]ODN74348.1 hypothetical protein L202_06764 [Cryptococcus amylolentus CBS 6039]
MTILPLLLLATATLSQAAPSSLISRNNNGAKIDPIRIIQGGYNSSYAVLEFNPFVTPNTLKVAARYNTSEGNLKPWLSRHPINSNIVVGCNDHAVPNAPGYLTSYSLDPKTGEMKYIDSVDTGGYPVPDYGVGAAHCAFFPDGKTAGVANYYGQSASTFSFDPQNGKFGSQTNKGLLDFPGYTPVEGQIGVAGNDNTSQATSHPHMIAPHPFLPVFYLPDLGEDKIHVYKVGANNSLSNFTNYQQPYGSGPRHLALTSNGQYMYVLHELAVNVRPYKVDQGTGELSQIQDDQPIYPSNATFSTNISAAEIHVSNDGRFLYASNRNLTAAALIESGDPSDTLAVWSIGNNGAITQIQSAMAHGARQIRAMELSPAGMTATAGGQDYIVAGGLTTNNTFVFKRDRQIGTLELVAQVEGTYQPATYLWLG